MLKPLKVSQSTKNFLKRDGTFNYTERTSESGKLPPGILNLRRKLKNLLKFFIKSQGTITYWLLGRRADGDTTIFTANPDQQSTASHK